MKPEHVVSWSSVGIMVSLAIALVAGTFIGTNFVSDVKASNIKLETTLSLDFQQFEKEQALQDRKIDAIALTQVKVARNLEVDTAILQQLVPKPIPQEPMDGQSPP